MPGVPKGLAHPERLDQPNDAVQALRVGVSDSGRTLFED
jgi:hypothetical protein